MNAPLSREFLHGPMMAGPPRGSWMEGSVQRADGYFLYGVGSEIHPLADFTWQDATDRKATTYGAAYFPLLYSRGRVAEFLTAEYISNKNVRYCWMGPT